MGATSARQRAYPYASDPAGGSGYASALGKIPGDASFPFLGDNFKDLTCPERLKPLQSHPEKSRHIFEFLRLDAHTASIVYLGTVAAGPPLEALEITESIDVPKNFLGNGNNFALRVRGDSMVEEGIREGDILIVARQTHAENGQTVVALVGGESTVKKVYHHGEEVELRPANCQMRSIRISANEVEIVGKVVGLLRHYSRRPPHAP